MEASQEYVKEILELSGKPRRVYDFSLKKYKFGKFEHYRQKIFQILPVNMKIHENFMKSFFKSSGGNIVKVTGVLSSYPFTVSKEMLESFEKNYNLNFRNGYFTYKIESSLSGIESDVYVISSADDARPDLGTPLEVRLKKLNYNIRNLFYLQNFQPTFLNVPDMEANFHVLRLKDMRSSLLEASPFVKVEHIANAILATYVGSDITKHKVNGVNSSYYKSALKPDLLRIHESLSGSGIKISDFGVHNMFEGSIQGIEALRIKSIGKFRNISCNVGAQIDLENIRNADFKFTVGKDTLDVQDTRDLKNNFDFLQSLLFLINKDKRISPELHGEVVNAANKRIMSFYDKDESAVSEVMDMINIEEQTAKICSYFQTFGEGEKAIIENVEETVIHNIVDIINEKQREIDEKKQGGRQSKHFDIKKWEGIPNFVRIKFAINASNRTESGIIEKLMSICGYTEKKSISILKELVDEKGILFFDGRIYRWKNESNINFK